MPFTTAIMSCGSFSGSFKGWKALHTGIDKPLSTRITVSGTIVTVEVSYGGTLIMVK